MSQTAVLVWLSATSVLPTFRADLDGFAQSRLLRFEAPRENAATFRAAAYAPDVVAQVEIMLEEGRNATASLEQSRALSALEHAERLLHDHPELPQGAWLMAEQLNLTADVENTAPDGASAASALRKRAAALEGLRATPFSDHASAAELEPPAQHALAIEGVEPGDTLEWDGVRSGAALSTAAGEHQVRVSRNGRLLWAGWVQIGESEPSVRLPVPETPPCSPDDVGAGHFEAGRAVPAPNARCESYVLARAHPGGGIDAALCERTTCGAVVIWDQTKVRLAAPPTAERTWPPWATYTIVASAGAIATGLILWRAGVFDRPAQRTTTNLVYDGQVKPMGFRF
jgi:hypothetical protein